MYVQFTSWVQEDFIMKTQSFEQETDSYHWRRSGTLLINLNMFHTCF